MGKNPQEKEAFGQRGQPAVSPPGVSSAAFFACRGWEKIGNEVLRRTACLPLARPLPRTLPAPLPLLLPDLVKAEGAGPEHLLFFDLETTGLSGGAGTVAFLAAFGKFAGGESANDADVPDEYTHIEITQFLLLDYPGEPDFLNAVLFFISSHTSLHPAPDSLNPNPGPLLTTYNGKTFDAPLFKTRCILYGFAPPEFVQLDLLYPSRRLWKRILPNCSQATVETSILGLSRAGDLAGALAPDIWFDFLRAGGGAHYAPEGQSPAERLLGICEHNAKDIAGLAALFAAFCGIAASPLDAEKKYFCDAEKLAMLWRRACRARLSPFQKTPAMEETAGALLKAAAAKWPRAALRYGLDLLREKKIGESRAYLEAALAREEALPKNLAPWLREKMARVYRE